MSMTTNAIWFEQYCSIGRNSTESVSPKLGDTFVSGEEGVPDCRIHNELT